MTALRLKACNSNLIPEHHTDPTHLAMPQQTKQAHNRARAKELPIWEPQISMEEGAHRLVNWPDHHAP